MSKQAMREEADRLIREALEKGSVKVTQVDTRVEAVCGKCGAPNRVKLPMGQSRAEFKCKECGHKQRTL